MREDHEGFLSTELKSVQCMGSTTIINRFEIFKIKLQQRSYFVDKVHGPLTGCCACRLPDSLTAFTFPIVC